jgi:hypothetical protein
MPRQPSPQPAAPAQPKHAKQTGPKTPAGKARSKLNARKHGLRAAAAVLPEEDPAEYEQFVDGVLADLAPAGVLEEELARQAAAALWRLRRADAWEAARARLTGGNTDLAARLAGADADIAELRAELAGLQRDPAADPPFAVALLSLPDDAQVDALEVTDLWQAWADDLPDPDAAPTLEQVCDRAGLPEGAASEPGDWPGWTAGLARRLVAALARDVGMTPEAYLAGPVQEWRAGLADERAHRATLARLRLPPAGSTGFRRARSGWRIGARPPGSRCRSPRPPFRSSGGGPGRTAGGRRGRRSPPTPGTRPRRSGVRATCRWPRCTDRPSRPAARSRPPRGGPSAGGVRRPRTAAVRARPSEPSRSLPKPPTAGRGHGRYPVRASRRRTPPAGAR